MSTKSEKDRAKAQQDKFQAILSALLKDEDNKYCEDCDAKGPRWASWNLGVFLCIRCAGIHRNLGVHISKVKSVNLDTWTAEQVAMMQEMGNSRARAVYEAQVPDTFRRPQTDSALEAFVRAKYEQKKYIAREWVPPKPTVPKEWLEDDKDKKKARSNKTVTSLNAPPSQPAAHSAAPLEVKSAHVAAAPAEPKPQPQPPKPKSGSDDLLGLDAEVPQPQSGGQGGDLLADLFGGSPASPNQQQTTASQQNGTAEANLFDDGGSAGQGEKKSAKDSIMALYGSGGGQQQMFGVPGGMYMPQQPMYSGMGTPPMMQQQQGMMGQPMQQGMMGMQQQPAMYGGMGPMGGQQMGSQQMGMMGNQAAMMGRGGPGGMGGHMYMQQQPGMGQQMPTQQMQQMQFQQMQQQMASMKVGGGQMGQSTAVASGGSWGGGAAGHTLSTNLWQ